ncbi:MAG: FAD-dependent oxidoreductase [Eggerthellaceae bacterium]
MDYDVVVLGGGSAGVTAAGQAAAAGAKTVLVEDGVAGGFQCWPSARCTARARNCRKAGIEDAGGLLVLPGARRRQAGLRRASSAPSISGKPSTG